MAYVESSTTPRRDCDSASARRAGARRPGGRGGEREARRALSLLRATPRDPPRARHPRCPLRSGRGAEATTRCYDRPAARGRSDICCFVCPPARAPRAGRGGNNDARPFPALDTRPRTAARPRPMASTVPSGPSEASSGSPATPVASHALGDGADARDAPPSWRSALDAYLADYDSRGAPSATKWAPAGTAPPPPRSLPPDPRPPLGNVDVNLARQASDEALRRRLNARLTDGLHLASAPASGMPTSSRLALPSPTLRLPPPDDATNHPPESALLPPARTHDERHIPWTRPRPRPRPRPFRASWSSALSSSAASASTSDDDDDASSRPSSRGASSHETRRSLEDEDRSDVEDRGEVRARTSSTLMVPARAPTTRMRSRSRSRSRPSADADALALTDAPTIASPPSPEALEEARVDALLARMGVAIVVPSSGSNPLETRDDGPTRERPPRSTIPPPLPPPAPSARGRERRRGRRPRPASRGSGSGSGSGSEFGSGLESGRQ